MTALSRKRLEYDPSTLNAPIFLAQDIDELDALWYLKQSLDFQSLDFLLSASAVFEIEAKRQRVMEMIAQILLWHLKQSLDWHLKQSLDILLDASVELEMEARRLRVTEMIARILWQRGQILLSHQRYHEALSALTEANKVLGYVGQQDLKVRVYAALAETHSQMKAWPTVLSICQQGIALVEQYRYQVSGQYLQSSYLRSRIGLYAHGVRAAYELEAYELMLEWTELSKCRSILRQQEPLAETSEAVERIEQQFHHVCLQIDEARSTKNETALNTLLTKRRVLWDLLLIQHSQLRSVALPAFNLATVQAELLPDEAILYYYWLDAQTLLIVFIDKKQQKAILRSFTEQQSLMKYSEIVLESLSPEMAGYLEHVDKIKAFAPFLLPAEMAAMLQAKHRLLISPHQLLHALPFQALPWDETHPFLIQRFAITYIPNLSSLLLSYRQPNSHSLLALGISDFTQHDEQHDPLKEVEQEIAELKTLYRRHEYNIQTLFNSEANEARLRQLETTGDLANFNCLHISTHGQNVNSDIPMESFMVLYDSVLEGLEIANWRLNAELTVLSACCSGQRPFRGRRMDELPGDDLFGLQAAFFAAGTKRVLGSLWPVYPAAAQKIIMTFHRYWLSGQTPEVALQNAIIDYINQAGIKFRKSYYWASLFLSAVGRPRS
jgi:CHAT domain-containing protein